MMTYVPNPLMDELVPGAVAALHAAQEVARFARYTQSWHVADAPADAEDTILKLHHANFELWHLEDDARDPNAGDATIASVKRSIDSTNQRRNDLVERIDTELLLWLAAGGLPRASAPLHSETPGLILDRLSILSLKCFHTQEEIDRVGAESAHVERNRERLAVLEEQAGDLAGCLADLWASVCRGDRRFKLYRQMKMYNDPQLNPVLYTSGRERSIPDA